VDVEAISKPEAVFQAFINDPTASVSYIFAARTQRHQKDAIVGDFVPVGNPQDFLNISRLADHEFEPGGRKRRERGQTLFTLSHGHIIA
tara:strand:+ start:355 stop:621 length:267 start_codon:yes stop_codon:yes gene_type:complete